MRRFLSNRYFSTRPVPMVPDYYYYIYDSLPYEDPLYSPLPSDNKKNIYQKIDNVKSNLMKKEFENKKREFKSRKVKK